ncbi:MAG: 30S ribosomal protein S5 [Patescibacteria group bacterium]
MTDTSTQPTKQQAPGAVAPQNGPRQGGMGGGRQGQGGPRRDGQGGGRRDGGRGGNREEREVPEFDQTIVELARVTRVTKGGKRMRFRATVVIGDRKLRVGFGVAKAGDVQAAVNKAVRQAKKRLIRVPLVKDTIPYEVDAKFGAAIVKLMPAPKGSGVIAGGSLRTVLEFAGIPNISSKILGSKSKINNIKAAFNALEQLTRLQRSKN